MKSAHARNISMLAGLLLLSGTAAVRAQQLSFTNIPAIGNWSDGTKWVGGVAPNGVEYIGILGAGNATNTLDVPTTMGQLVDNQGSARGWLISASGTISMTMDNTGATVNNPVGNLDSYIGEGGSGGITFNPNIIIQNTDLDVANIGSTTPVLTIGTLGTSTIAATSARNLFIRQNQATSTKAITINSSIGGIGSSVITIQNAGTGGGVSTMGLNGMVGPNASIVQNSTNSILSLNNAANNYTGSTTITLGTLRVGAANAIPSVSTVTINTAITPNSTLNLAGFSDTIDALNGTGFVNGASGTPTLTIGGNNGSGTFSGVIQNTAGTLKLTKTGSGTETLSGANTYTGATAINGGILNAGIADGGTSGPFGNAGSISFGGGTLQYSAANQNDYSARFSTAANNAISIDTAGQSVTFATALTSSGGSLTKIGSGTLTLSAPSPETYSGNTAVNGGTLALASGNSLASSSTISIGAGGTLDVSALTSPYTLGGGASFKASGTGTTVGTTAANLIGASGGIFDLGSQPVSLTWGGGSSGTDSTHPSLRVSQGTLNFNGNTITVVVPGTALAPGVYTLISAPAITGTPNPVPSYTGGNGVALGNGGTISVSGSTVILTVASSGGVVGTWSTDLDGNWSDSSKWSGGVPHSAKDTAIFGTGSVLRTVNLDVNEIVGLITFNNNNSFVITNGANTLKLDNSGAGAAISVTAGTANAIQTAVALNDNTVLTVSSGKSLVISGPVSNFSGTRTLTVNGAGTTILSGANSFGPTAGTVGTTLSAGGTLQLGNNTALGAGDLSASGNSTLQAGAAVSVGNNIAIADTTIVNNNGNDLSLNGVISGAGGLTKIGNHTLTLNGNNLYSGNTTVNGGVLSLSSQNNVLNSPAIVLNGGDLLGSGTFAINNNIGIGLASGSVGTNALVDAASGQTFTLSGIIASSGNGGTDGLLINTIAPSPGTVDLAGANTFNGSTIIANGVLELDNALALQNSTLIYNTGTLIFGNGIVAATLGGLSSTNSSQSIGLTNTAGGALALTIGGNNASMIYGGNLADNGLGGSLIKAGTGTLTLSNANYTGGTSINTGSGAVTILAGNFGSASSTITVGAQLNLTGGNAAASVMNVAITGGQTGVGATIGGTANLTNITTTIGSGGNTAGPMTVNSSGLVNLGDVKVNKDNGVGNGLVVAGGNVFAASINIGQSGTGGKAADLNVTGGVLTVSDASQSGKFVLHGGGGNPTLTMSGGVLNYFGTDGLLMSVGGGNSVFTLTAGTAALTGVTLNSGSSATTSTLTVGGATSPSLFLGNVGLVVNSPGTTIFASFGKSTIGALADWSSSAPITLAGSTNIVIFQAADTNNVAHNISLSGVLSGAAGLTKTGNGTLTLSAAESYTGNTINNAGTLAIGSDGSINSTTNITIASGAVLDTTGAGGLTIGTSQSLTAGHTSGSITDVNGDLIISGSLNIAGTGVAGTLVQNGNLTFNSGGKVSFDLSSTTNGANDQLVLNGTGNLTCGTINVGINCGATLATNDYVLFNLTGGGSVVGNFYPTPVWLGTVPVNANQYSVKTIGTTVVLHYFSGTLPSASLAVASPSTVVRNQSVTFSVTGVPGTGGSSINSIVMDLSLIGGSSSQPLVNNGSGTFTNTFTISPSTAVGILSLPVVITDNLGTIGATNISLTVSASTEVWNGNDGANNTIWNWSDNLNWVGGLAPGYVGDSLVFTGNNNQPVVDQNYSVPALTFNAAASSFNLTSSGGILTLTGGVTNNSANAQTLNLPVVLSGAVTVNAAAGNVNEAGTISGTGSLTTAGATTNILSGANTFNGGVNLNGGFANVAGTETPGTSGPLGVTGRISFGGGTLQYSGTDTADYSSRFSTNANQAYSIDTASQAVTFTSALTSSNGTLTKIGNGTLTLSNAASSFSGNVAVNGDTLNVFVAAANNPTTTTLGAQSAARTIAVNSGATLNFSVNNVFGNVPSASAPRIVINHGTLNITRFNSFGLSGSNSISALTLTNGGVLNASDTVDAAPFFSGNLGDLVTVNGTTGSSIAGANPIDLWNGTSTNSGTGGSTTFNVSITGSAVDLDVSAPLSNTGWAGTNAAAGLVKTGAGVMRLNAANTYTGSTVVSNGTLLVNGSIGSGAVTIVGGTLGGSGTIGGVVANQSGGTLAPGAGASVAGTVLTISQGLALNAGSTTVMAVSHSTLANDQVVCVAVNYGGTLTVTTNAGDTGFVAGDTFKLFNSTASSYTSSFATLNLPPLGAGLAWSNSLATDGSIEVVAGVSTPAPVSAFAALSSANIFVTQSVTFTNLATGSITNWVWNFGDGTIVTNTTGVNVSHQYNSVSSDNVSLTVNGAGGSSAAVSNNYVVVKAKVALGRPVLSGGQLILGGTNGPAGQVYRILSTTNVALPAVSWTPVYTNVFAPDGSYGYTNTPLTNKATFFKLVSP